MARSRRGGRGRGYGYGYGDAGRDAPELRPFRADLNIHTPFSADFQDPDATYLQILQTAEARGLDIIALTDHNSAGGVAAMRREVEDLSLLEELGRLTDDEASILAEYRRLLDRLLVLPGFTLTAAYGFPVLGIFPPETTVRRLEHILLLLGVTEAQLDSGTAEANATADVIAAYEIIDEYGGLAIPAQVNEPHGVGQSGRYGEATRIAYTQSPLIAALDVTDLEDASRRGSAALYNGTRPDYPRRMHFIQSSDAHRLMRAGAYRDGDLGIGERAMEFALPERSFAALRALFLSDDYSREKPYAAASPVASDPISAAREAGATITQSFHEQARSRRSRYRPLLRDIVAFANTNGGTLYIGMSANPAAPVVGVPLVDEVGRGLRDSVTRSIIPPLDVTITVEEVAGKAIIVVGVPKGPDTPYTTDAGQVFVRQGAESVIALRDEIVQLVRETSGDRVWTAPRPAYDPEDDEAEAEASPETLPALPPRPIPPARIAAPPPAATPVANMPPAPLAPPVAAPRPATIATPAPPRPTIAAPEPFAMPPRIAAPTPLAAPIVAPIAPPRPVTIAAPASLATPVVPPTPPAPPAPPAPMASTVQPTPATPSIASPPTPTPAPAPVVAPRSPMGAPSPIGGAPSSIGVPSPIGSAASVIVSPHTPPTVPPVSASLSAPVPAPAPTPAPPTRAVAPMAAPVAPPVATPPLASPVAMPPLVSPVVAPRPAPIVVPPPARTPVETIEPVVPPPPEPEPEIAADLVGDALEADGTDDDDDTDTDAPPERGSRRRPSRRRGGRRRGRGDATEDETETDTETAALAVTVAVAADESGEALAAVTAPLPLPLRTPPAVPPLPVYSLELPTPEPPTPEPPTPELPPLVSGATEPVAEPLTEGDVPADALPQATTPRRRRRSGGRGRGAAPSAPTSESGASPNGEPGDGRDAEVLAVAPVETEQRNVATINEEASSETGATIEVAPVVVPNNGASFAPSVTLDLPAPDGSESIAPRTEPATAGTTETAAGVTPPPAGVEILAMAMGEDGLRRYTLRDLKTGREMMDVLRRSARGQWRQAVIAREDRLTTEERIVWHGARGFGRTVQREGGAQHDLALRTPDGIVRIFYAVPDSELDAAWQAVLP